MNNKYNINIYSCFSIQNFINNYKGKETIAVISIRGSHNEDKEFNLIPNKNIKILKVYFEDITLKDVKRGCEEEKLMSIKDAEIIKKFINYCIKNKINNFAVQCYAGISRSVAIAMAISKYLNGDDFEIWKSGKCCPNKYCLKLMYQVFHIEFNEDEFHKKYKIGKKFHKKKCNKLNLKFRERKNKNGTFSLSFK